MHPEVASGAVTYEEAQQAARTRGVSRPVYELTRFLILPLVKLLWRLQVSGKEHIPKSGPVIIAPNHKSMYDPFLVGLATRRPVRFMAKSELFGARSGRYISRLGAFPLRRGQADPEALETARMILEAGGVLALFPEGTRHKDPDTLGSPRRGAGRLAIETGAPIVPCALTGTERMPKPGRVRIAFAPPIPVSAIEATPEAAGDLIENQVWPEVEREFKLLRGIAVAAAVTAAAAGGGVAIAAQQRKPRTRAQRVKARIRRTARR
jgi:1-acyl-sn-glycerol-3-phosphate acyltransferase